MRALTIARRELYAYTRSPLGSAIIAAALLVDGILFYYASVDTKKLSAQLLAQFFYDSTAATMGAGLLLSMRLLRRSVNPARSRCSTPRRFATGTSCSANSCPPLAC